MKYFFATKYLHYDGYPELISIGIVSEKDDYFYAINQYFNAWKADQFIVDTVLNHLPPPPLNSPVRSTTALAMGKMNSRCNEPWEPNKEINEHSDLWREEHQICSLLIKFLKGITSVYLTGNFTAAFQGEDITQGTEKQIQDKFELVNFLWDSVPKEPIELWGYQASIDYTILRYLYGNWPKGFPAYAKDVRQECDRLDFIDIPPLADTALAIEKAIWVKDLYDHICPFQKIQT